MKKYSWYYCFFFVLSLCDLQTGDYEGNLFEDSSVKDTRNPALHNHGGKSIIQVTLSDDGRYLLVGSEDGTASMWDVEDEVRIHTYRGHSSEVILHYYYCCNNYVFFKVYF